MSEKENWELHVQLSRSFVLTFLPGFRHMLLCSRTIVQSTQMQNRSIDQLKITHLFIIIVGIFFITDILLLPNRERKMITDLIWSRILTFYPPMFNVKQS